MASDWKDIYIRDKDGGTDIMFDGGVSGWPVHVTDNDLRLLRARLLERAGGRYEVRDDSQSAWVAGPDGRPFTAETAAGYARTRNAGGSRAYHVVALVPLEAEPGAPQVARQPRLEDTVNSDEHDYDEEAVSRPLIAGEHEGEGPSGDHLPDCEMFTGYDGSAACSCGGIPCESGFSIGPAHDPYGVSCEYIQREHPERGGRRIHRGVSPLPGPGPEPQYLEWSGGGYCARDPLPVRDIVHLAADGRRES